MKYVKLEWPEVQTYMLDSRYDKESYFDPVENVWFIPLWLRDDIDKAQMEEPACGSVESFDRNDCWDAIGGDWQG